MFKGAYDLNCLCQRERADSFSLFVRFQFLFRLSSADAALLP